MAEAGGTPRDHAKVEIVVEGHLSDDWAEWFDCTISRRFLGRERQAMSVLRGRLDQAALYGLLTRLRDLGLRLLSVRHLQEGQAESNESEERTL